MGTVSAQAAERWGLPEGIPVTLAGHDHLSGAVGAGAGPRDLVNSVGTAETVIGYTEQAPDVARALELRTTVSAAPGGEGWSVFAGAARAGVVLAAAAELLGGSIAELDALAESAEPAEVGGVVEALQSGHRIDLGASAPGAVWRGLLMALAARTAESAGRLLSLGIQAERLLVIGGGSRCRPWLAAKARLSPLPVAQPRTSQAVARGAALFAGTAAGWWPTPTDAPKVDVEPCSPE
jgi:xylulokinase